MPRRASACKATRFSLIRNNWTTFAAISPKFRSCNLHWSWISRPYASWPKASEFTANWIWILHSHANESPLNEGGSRGTSVDVHNLFGSRGWFVFCPPRLYHGPNVGHRACSLYGLRETRRAGSFRPRYSRFIFPFHATGKRRPDGGAHDSESFAHVLLRSHGECGIHGGQP